MSIEKITAMVLGGLLFVVVTALIYRRIPKRLKKDNFHENWKQLQFYCKDKATWPDAIKSADRLLDSALKKRKFKGKSMGERMVSAQRLFTNNDGVWYAHNLYKKIIVDDDIKLREDDVKNALLGFRQALRDIGALPNGETKS